MDRKAIILCAAPIPLGLAGGYAWSALTAPPPRTAAPPKARIADIPESPEALPEVQDQEWTARADDKSTSVATGSEVADRSVYYSGCNEVRAAGKAPLHSGDPGYRVEMDGDGDGIACEPIRSSR
jgi:excalibur calcium-binding domain-containing protein